MILPRSCPSRRGHRRPRRRIVLIVCVLCLATAVLLFNVAAAANADSNWDSAAVSSFWDSFWVKRMPVVTGPPRPLGERVPCRGPRGHLLSSSADDELRCVKLNISYPTPFFGSHKDVGLDQSWMTADGRYGPYGYGEENQNYGRAKVDWDKVDWGQLQNECFGRNEKRFPEAARRFTNEPRFDPRETTKLPAETPTWDMFPRTRRTAIVVRAYDGFRYKPEDMYNLRSLVVETSLRTGGEYAVVLLVNIRGKESNIFESRESYDRAFEQAEIPKEFRSIAILWDESLLRSWYPTVGEHRTEWQVFQPLQLFALHYPEFDHYWQLEMDIRFLGDAGRYLDAVSAFARAEPRKQALERSTFIHMESLDGDYRAFSTAVNTANAGGSRVWGPLRIPDVNPIGPVPPFRRPEDDSAATWGVGEDADVIVTSPCANATASTTWVYRDWVAGFRRGRDTPRLFCPPAIMRSSRALALAVHAAQASTGREQGMRIPSESTLPSFALWHGLKMSYPPQPVYARRWDDEDLVRDWYRGGPGNYSSAEGGRKDERRGKGGLGPADPQRSAPGGLTWWWESSWPREIFDAWVGDGLDEAGMPYLLAVHEGEVYVPNLALHPVKTQ